MATGLTDQDRRRIKDALDRSVSANTRVMYASAWRSPSRKWGQSRTNVVFGVYCVNTATAHLSGFLKNNQVCTTSGKTLVIIMDILFVTTLPAR